MKNITIYTDGACSGNPGPGGYGAILIYNETEKVISGFEKETTNNRMELLAAIESLNCLKYSCEVDLYSDSAYLVNAFDKGWIFSWEKNGWIKGGKSNDEVKNIDLWKILLQLYRKHKINFIKVKGHSDNIYNNRCDKLATDQIKFNT